MLLALTNQSNVLVLFSENVFMLPPLLLRTPYALSALRALRLVQHHKELLDLVTAMMLSLPSLVNVSSLLGLIIFIYSVLGVNLFTYIRRGLYFTDERNFDDFGNAVLLNFQP